jgi:predicted branched-subunit amino acid permease
VEESKTMVNGAVITTIGSSFDQVSAFFDPLKIWVLLAVVLIICDLRFGVAAAKTRGEKIRKSRAFRRSMSKFVDYVCWVTLAGVLGKLFDNTTIGIYLNWDVLNISVTEMLLFIMVYFFEINSCYNNYCESRGINGWDIKGWFKKKTGMEIMEKKPEHKETDLIKNNE